jgi:hypothetical protein
MRLQNPGIFRCITVAATWPFGDPPDCIQFAATDLNNRMEVVGGVDCPGGKRVWWDRHTGFVDPIEALGQGGWELETAISNNDQGPIAGWGARMGSSVGSC